MSDWGAPCPSVSGNWLVAVQGGSGGNRYDYSGSLLIGENNGQNGLVNMQEVPELGSIKKAVSRWYSYYLDQLL
jgi:hypothetical protein